MLKESNSFDKLTLFCHLIKVKLKSEFFSLIIQFLCLKWLNKIEIWVEIWVKIIWFWNSLERFNHQISI